MKTSNRIVVAGCGLLSLAALSQVSSCKSKNRSATAPGMASQVSGPTLLALEDAEDGLTFELSQGRDDAGTKASALKVATASKISESDAKKLLNRMPALVSEAGDKKTFALRAGSQPPPKTGTTSKIVFPPKNTRGAPAATTPASKDLQVLRYAPEGDVPIAPHVSVTFNQPMVAVTSHDDSTKNVPVRLTPQPPGQWRWVGTRTLLFDPDVRFPMATDYTVSIPAGTPSSGGEKLTAAKTFSFSTPAPRMMLHHPSSGPQKLDPAMFVLFDQKIDPAAILNTVVVKGNGTTYPVRAATEAEIERDKTVASLIRQAKDNDHSDRYAVFVPTNKLPADTSIDVTIGPGTPSLEGPKKTTSAQSFYFRTFGPLRVEEYRCSYGSTCPPGSPWYVSFTNPIDHDAFDGDTIAITPDLARRRIHGSDRWLNITGASKARTAYTVTLPAALKDEFGQTLGKPEVLTFRTGDAEPQVFAQDGLVIADPASKKRSFDVQTINVKELSVVIHKTNPSDWSLFLTAMTNHGNPRQKTTLPGSRVFSGTVATQGKIDEMSETRIDLAKALSTTGHGHAVVSLEPKDWPNEYKPRHLAWVQATDIGLDAFKDSSELLAWASDLRTGAPMQGVSLRISPDTTHKTSGAGGLATLPLPTTGKGPALLMATRGDDTAFLPENTYWWSGDGSSWRKHDPGLNLSWFVFDDRQMYRPKEEVHFKGWLRVLDNREGGDIEGLRNRVQSVDYTVVGPSGNELLKGQTKVNALGGFDAKFKLPETPNLGEASLRLVARGAKGVSSTEHYHSFQIQEFRRPEYEVTTSVSEGPHLVGGGADVTVSAQYYAGGPLPGADTQWDVSATPTSFTPPNRDEFTFGFWTPWWSHMEHFSGRPVGPSSSQSLLGKTDGAGKHVLHLDFLAAKPPQPMSVVAQARVTDVNRQAWAAASTLLVHPADFYVGIKRDKYFVEKGKPIEIEAIAVDHDGKAIEDRETQVRSVRLDWEYKNGEYKEIETDEQECVFMSRAQPSPCSFKTPEGGSYRITATVVDDVGRPNQTQLIMWVSGGELPPVRNVEQEQVTLIPDKKEYAPGDTAEILVQSPFFPAEGLLTVRRSGIVKTERFALPGPTTTVKVAITEGHIPNLYVQVDLVGSAERVGDDGKARPKLPRRPAYAQGLLNLAVPPKSRTLTVIAEPRAKRIEPGGSTTLKVEVKNAQGQPVEGAETAIVVVDESVLALSGYSTPNPVNVFYSARDTGTTDYRGRQYLRLANADQIATETAALGAANGSGGAMLREEMAPASAPMEEAEADDAEADLSVEDRAAPKSSRARLAAGALGQPGAAQTAIAVRTNFNALAVFNPEVKTDASGHALLKLKVPDNLTRYRIMVVAVHGDNHFGSGESNITARMPLMVRPSPPRFLNFGDTFELPVVIQNQTDSAMTVDVALRTTNLTLRDGSGRRLQVAANDRVEVRFPAGAEMPGTARFQIAAQAGRFADGTEAALPVWTPATTEAFATYGEIDNGNLRQPVAMPSGVVRQFGGLEISTSSTQLQALTDAFLYLIQYPFECAEQTSSRILAIAALRDVLSAFKAEGMPTKNEVESAIERDIERLRTLQNGDGGFAFWTRGYESWPYISIHAAHALSRAKDKGYTVPESMLSLSQSYLRNIEQHIPHYYPEAVKRTLIAYALYTRNRLGDRDLVQANSLWTRAGGPKGLSMEAIGWLLSVLSGDSDSRSKLSELHRYLDNQVTETAASANWSTSYNDGAHLILHSDRRTDGVLLEALIKDKPKSDMIAKVVRGLLAHQIRGRWANTQENAFVLLAMDAYFQNYEKVTPNFVAQVWFGDQFAGSQPFRGRSTNTNQIDIPMEFIAQKNGGDVTIAKQGNGRLYYRIGMKYAPSDLRLPPADHGFAVERKYEAINAPTDVSRAQDGSWHIKAGAMVRVRVTLVAENRRAHVALVDPMPAGIEAMNPALAVTGAVPQDPAAQKQDPWWWWTRTWYEHQNMRDERAEAFAALLWAGVHEYSYVARATTPGRFVVPPAKAEEMYHPETFGRSAGDIVVVK